MDKEFNTITLNNDTDFFRRNLFSATTMTINGAKYEIISVTYTKSNKLKKRIKNAPENTLIFENTHEAIIDRKIFDTVQKHFEGRKRPDINGEMDKYAGYLYCGDCGKRMHLHRSKTMPAEKNYFQCGGYQQGKSRCTVHNIKEQVLDTIILTQLKSMIAMASENSDEFYAMATEKGKAEAKKCYASAEKEKAKLTARLHELNNIIRCLYEDRVVGRISPERYDEMAVGYEEELAEQRKTLTDFDNDLTLYSKQQQAIKDFIAKAKEYVEMPKLTEELLHAFIHRVDVYEKPTKYSRTEGNPVMIYYKYQLTPQENTKILFGEGFPTPEELESSKADDLSISA